MKSLSIHDERVHKLEELEALKADFLEKAIPRYLGPYKVKVHCPVWRYRFKHWQVDKGHMGAVDLVELGDQQSMLVRDNISRCQEVNFVVITVYLGT